MALTSDTTIAQIEWARYTAFGSSDVQFHLVGDPGDLVYGTTMSNPVDTYGLGELLIQAWLDAGNTPGDPTEFQTLPEAKEFAHNLATRALQQYLEQLRYFTVRAVLQSATYDIPADIQQAIDDAYNRYDAFVVLINSKTDIEEAAAMRIDLDQDNDPGY